MEDELRQIREIQKSFNNEPSAFKTMSFEEKAAIDNRSVFVGNVGQIRFVCLINSFAFRLITAQMKFNSRSIFVNAAQLRESRFPLIVFVEIKRDSHTSNSLTSMERKMHWH